MGDEESTSKEKGPGCFQPFEQQTDPFDQLTDPFDEQTDPFGENELPDFEYRNNSGKHNDLRDMTFCMRNYLKSIMKMIFKMRSHRILTDIVLEVGSELFHAHKIILASSSPYFKVYFTYN